MYSHVFRRRPLYFTTASSTYFKIILVVGLFLCVTVVSSGQAKHDSERFWIDKTAGSNTSFEGETIDKWEMRQHLVPGTYRVLKLDAASFRAFLMRAPIESETAVERGGLVVSLPLPDGRFSQYRVFESSVFTPELALQYPDIKTYKGFGIDDPTATTHFEMTSEGFRAMQATQLGNLFIDPAINSDRDTLVVYNKRDYFRSDKDSFFCSVGGENRKITGGDISEAIPQPPVRPNRLRTYRLAMGVTWGYVSFHFNRGTTAANAIATTISRNNVMYERDLAIRLLISATIIPTSAANDPYVKSDGTPMTGNEAYAANQGIIDGQVGSGNYDIGHVMGTNGSGGRGDIGQVCNSGNIFIAGRKANGMTFTASPVGDPFDVDYVAHEFGHQFGGNHTWNAINSGSCVAGGRSDIASYEIGGGTTIMAYAGICGDADLQQNSDSYFHAKSVEQILLTTTTGDCNCGQEIGAVNQLPFVDAGTGYNVPAYTPFALTATGSDPDGQPLTYSWQQSNLGDSNPPYGDNGNRPLFRAPAGLPSTSPTRTFPSINYVLNNDNSPPDNYTSSNGSIFRTGEVMPFVDQTMDFTVTARDGAGGVALDTTSVYITNTGPSFKVLVPDGGEVWNSGADHIIQWRVSGTDAPPISATHVNILLSVDGGVNFSTILTNTPNDGSETVYIGNQSTFYAAARIKIEAAGNIFFDISNANFSLRPAYAVSGHVQNRAGQPEPSVTITLNELGTTTTTNAGGNFTIIVPGSSTFSLTPSRAGTTFSPTTLTLPVLSGNYSIPDPFLTNGEVQISGRIKDQSGANLSGITVDLNGGEQTAVTNANGIYQFDDVIEGSNYTVSPLSGDHQFTPLNHLIMNLSGNTTVPDFTGRSLRHKLVGTIREQGTNQPVVGVTVTLSGTQSGTVQTNPMGRYEFPNLHETGTYTVTPTFGYWEFVPPSQTFNNFPGDQTQDFVGISPPLIIGTIRDICGDTVSGVAITANPSGSTVATDGAGNFSLPVPRGGTYTITPLLAGWSFDPANRNIPSIAANVPGQNFLATPPTIDYVWTGIGAGTGPNFDASWANPNNWTVNNQPTNGRFPRCVDYATIETSTAVHLAGPRTVKRFTYRAGEVYGGELTVTERMDWHGAGAANQNALIYNADLTIPNGSELHLQGSDRKALHGGVLTNEGTIVWTGEYISLDSTALNSVCRIDNFGTLRLESTIDFQLFLNGGTTCVFNNKAGAVITKPVVANYAPNTVFQQFSSFSNAKLNNEGTISTNAGRLLILGSAQFKNGTRFEGGGVTLLNGGLTTKKVSGQVTIANGATLETGIGGLDGNGYGGVTLEGTPAGSINTEGTGTFLVGSFTDFDGTINLYGKTDIEVTTNTSNPSVSLETANNGIDTINNNGTVNWRGNTLYIGSSVFNNHGTFNILSDDILQSQGSVPGVGSVFNNFSDGTVRKSNTSGVTDFMTYPFLSRFDNSGLVDIQTGKMLIHNGLSSGKFRTAANTEIEIQQNEMFTFLGADLESGGVFRNNGGTMSGSFRGTLQMLSGNVAGDMTALSPTSTLPGGTFDWRGGLIGNANMSPTPTIFIIQADAAMLIDASDQATFSGSFGNTVVTNNGTVQWTGQENTNIGVGDGGNNTGLIFHNNGTVFLQSDGTLFRHGDSSIMTFNNNASGIFKKSGGNGSTNLDVFGHDFNNFGTIEINSGVIEGGSVEFEFKNNSRIKSGGGRLSLNGGGGTSDAVGTVTLEGSGDPDNFVLELGGESNGVTLDGNGLTFLSSNSGGFLWTGGTIKGNVVLGTGLRTKIRSAGIVSNVTLDGSLSNGGTFALENGMDWHFGSSGSSTFTNLAGGTFDHQTAGIINNQSGFEFNFVNAGTMNIGGPTGVFNVSGAGVNAVNFTNQTTGVVNMDIGGAADFDKLMAPASMNFGGRLNVNFTGGFEPTGGDEFKIFDGQLTGMARQGAFSQVSVPNINGKSLRLDYNDDDLTLQTAAVFIWSGAVDGNWNDPANWQGGQVPTADGLVEIPETGVVNSPDLGSMSVNVANLVVGDGQNVIVGDGQTITVDGVLKLDGGDVDTTGSSLRRLGGANGGLLVIGANGAVDRTDGQVNGKMSKIFAGPSSFTFPVGTASGYSPVDVNATAGNGQMTVEAKQGIHPNASATSAISRFWTLQGSGITSNLTFHYLDGDVNGMESLYQILKVSGGTSTFYPHSPPQVTVDAVNNSGSVSGVTSYSDWTMSANLGPTAANASISGRLVTASGNGMAKAVVTISGGNLSAPRQVTTSSLGYYRLDGLTVGETYVVTVASKRYTFQTPSRLISLLDDAVDVDFTADQ